MYGRKALKSFCSRFLGVCLYEDVKVCVSQITYLTVLLQVNFTTSKYYDCIATVQTRHNVPSQNFPVNYHLHTIYFVFQDLRTRLLCSIRNPSSAKFL